MQSAKVVVIGSSYSSAAVFDSLEKLLTKVRQPIDLILIAERPYYFIKSLFSQFIANNCSLNSLCFSFRNILLLRPGVSFLQSEVVDININEKIVKTSSGFINYDYLILAPELDRDDFGEIFSDIDCFRINTLLDVISLKKQINECVDKASRENNIDLKNKLLTFSVIGAGKNGIETALSIYDFVFNLTKKQYPDLKLSQIKINLTDEKNVIPFQKDPFYNAKIFYILNKKKINLCLNSKVTRIDADRLILNNKDELYTSTIIFSGNYKYSSLINNLPLKKDDNHLGCVDLYSKADGLENVFIIGESSKCLDLNESNSHSLHFFYKQADTCANNLIARINNNILKPLRNIDELDFLSLGMNNSLTEIKGVYLDSIFVWFLYRLVNIRSVIGWKNKIKAFLGFLLCVFGLSDDETIYLHEISKQKKRIVMK